MLMRVYCSLTRGDPKRDMVQVMGMVRVFVKPKADIQLIHADSLGVSKHNG